MNLACCAARKPSGTKNLFGQKDDGRANKEFVTLGRGVGGIDELAASLDEERCRLPSRHSDHRL